MRSSTPVLDTPDKAAADPAPAPKRDRYGVTPYVSPPTDFDRFAARRFAVRLRRDKAAVAAIVLVALMTLCAILAPSLSPHDGTPNFANQLLPPSLQHPLGTDDVGRDLLLRVMQGGRVSLAAGASAMLFAVLIGVLAGAVAGYKGGIVDSLIMRTTDLFLSIPVFFVVLLLARVMTPGFLMICVLIGITQWMEVARVVRSVVLTTKEHEFVDAARALGMPDKQILFRHILSHTSGPVLISATIGVAQAIMMESALSFLGFGVQPPAASWGSMLTSAQSYLGVAPWMAIFPGLMIFFTVLCCYAFGDFLRTTLKPDFR